jgi:CheY-like chemotaxis protein
MRSTKYLVKNGVDINKSLELFGDIQTYNDTIGEFLISANSKLTKLSAYKNNKDMANYAIYVHSLKSDAKYFGLTKLADIAYEQEQKSKAGDSYYITEHFDDLLTEVTNAVKIIKEYLNGTDSDDEEPELIKLDDTTYLKETILVVDDSNIIRNFTKKIFEEKYNVGTAKNGQEAIDIIEKNKRNKFIVAVLLDLNMPKVDGFAVLEYMQKNDLFDSIPVSIISGDSTKATIDRAYQYPIVDMLEKPFSEKSIRSVVEKTLLYREIN